MQHNALISVVIPAYNRAETLQQTLGSVLMQTYRCFEALVIDDGSDLDLLEIVRSFNDTRLKYYKLEHTNANVARNFGIQKASGQYIAMLDSDDIWLENHLEDCLEKLVSANVDGLYGSLILKNMNTGQEQIAAVRALRDGETMMDYLLSLGFGAQTSTLFMTAESAKNITWNPELNRHQDYDFVVRYSKKYRLAAKENPTVIYRLSNSPKQIDFKSCIRFIRENADDIQPLLYNKYHQSMLPVAQKQMCEKKIISHYKNEATRYKEYIPYAYYMQIHYPRTRKEKLLCKLKFIFYILRIGVE